METALASGDVMTTQYFAVKIAELEHFDGEGGNFLAETSDGKTLCLAGRYLDSLVAKRVFPSLEFRTFVDRAAGFVYGVEPGPTPLNSWVVYGKLTDPVHFFVDGRLYDKTIAQLVAAVGGDEVRVACRASDA